MVTPENSTPTNRPPNHTKSPIVIDVDISAIGKKIELYHTVFNQAFLCFSLIFMKEFCSTSSLLNI